MSYRHSPRFCLLLAAGCFLMLAGCGGQKNPFDMAQVSGKITYPDGKPIEAAVVTVNFVPQNVAPVGGMHARPAQTHLMQDGSLSEFSTATRNDGVIVGKHKIVLTPWNADMSPCRSAVAKRYGDAETTPLEVEVTAKGPNRFELTVEKGR